MVKYIVTMILVLMFCIVGGTLADWMMSGTFYSGDRTEMATLTLGTDNSGSDGFDLLTVDDSTIFLDVPIPMCPPSGLCAYFPLHDTAYLAITKLEKDIRDVADSRIDWIVKHQDEGTRNKLFTWNTLELPDASVGDLHIGVAYPEQEVDEWHSMAEVDSILVAVSKEVRIRFLSVDIDDYPHRMATTEIALSNTPNPFSKNTTIEFSIHHTCEVTLKIYNVSGEELTTLLDDVRAAGIHRINWDGKDYSGKNMPAGIYPCELKTPASQKILRMILIK